jgi:hypothetical protein
MFRFSKPHHQGVTELYFSKYVHAFLYQHTQCNSPLLDDFKETLYWFFQNVHLVGSETLKNYQICIQYTHSLWAAIAQSV